MTCGYIENKHENITPVQGKYRSGTHLT